MSFFCSHNEGGFKEREREREREHEVIQKPGVYQEYGPKSPKIN